MNKSYFLDSVLLKRPTALRDYSYDLLPDTFLAIDKIPIVCKTHGVFYQRAYAHSSGVGCMKCSIVKNGLRSRLTTEDFISKSIQRYGDRFDYSKTVYSGKEAKLTITCKLHGDFTMSSVAHFRSLYGCSKCDFEIPRANRKARYIAAARKIHEDKYDYSRVVYTNTATKVEIVCPYHGSFWQGFYEHIAKHTGCPKCARDNDRLNLDAFIGKSRFIHNDFYSYEKTVYVTGQTDVVITCPKHGDFTQRASSHLSGNGCKTCFLEGNKLSTEDFVANARRVHGDTYDYSKVNYLGNKIAVEIVCPKHGSFWQKPNSHISSKNGCKLCYESKGEKAVEVVLKKYGIEHVREYRIPPYLYRYDFFLPKFNVFIEFHGHQHYQPVGLFGGDEAHQLVKKNDRMKVRLVNRAKGHLIVLNHLNLTEGSVEKELLKRLKRIIGDKISLEPI